MYTFNTASLGRIDDALQWVLAVVKVNVNLLLELM